MFNCAATPPSGVRRSCRLEQTKRVSAASERQINIVRRPRAAVRFTLFAIYVFINSIRAKFCPRRTDESKQGRLRLQPALFWAE